MSEPRIDPAVWKSLTAIFTDCSVPESAAMAALFVTSHEMEQQRLEEQLGLLQARLDQLTAAAAELGSFRTELAKALRILTAAAGQTP